jgi:hypothetical protein
MARLKNNGFEIARFEKVFPGDAELEWRKRLVSLRSNGWIMKKEQVRFKAQEPVEGSCYSRPAYNRDWGWKKAFRVKEVLSLDEIVAVYANEGYRLVL